MADRKPRTGELTTANYGWTKPTVGASDDQWGGYLNADLDGIDGTVKGVSNVANAAYPASNPAGYVTAAAIPAPYVLPTASTTVLGGVKVDGATITIAGGTISATTTGGASITVSDTAPANPVAGALWFDSVGGQLYLFYQDLNSSQWVIANNAMVGPAGPQGPAVNDNKLINGDMRIDQRNNGAAGMATGYTVDRWTFTGTQASKGTWQGIASAPAPGFPYALFFASGSAYTPLATDTFFFAQPIEADMISDFQWGTANAQPVTLSFWVNSSITGTHSGSIGNYAGTRAYPFTFSNPTANIWAKVAVTIPGDTAGTWVMSGAAGALSVHFDLGSGANFRGPAGAWGSVNANGANGAVKVVSVSSAQFLVTGVKLEIGSVATPYNRQSLAKSMADCQRYYQTMGVSDRYLAYIVSEYSSVTAIFPFMRATPTTIQLSAGSVVNNVNWALSSFTAISNNSARFEIASAAGTDTTNGTDTYALFSIYSLNAEL